MKTTENTLMLQETELLLQEIDSLKQELTREKQQHKHWEELAMLFHDALWRELRFSHKVSFKQQNQKLTDTKIQNDKLCCRQHNHKKSGHSFIRHSVFFVVFNSARW